MNKYPDPITWEQLEIDATTPDLEQERDDDQRSSHPDEKIGQEQQEEK